MTMSQSSSAGVALSVSGFLDNVLMTEAYRWRKHDICCKWLTAGQYTYGTDSNFDMNLAASSLFSGSSGSITGGEVWYLPIYDFPASSHRPSRCNSTVELSRVGWCELAITRAFKDWRVWLAQIKHRNTGGHYIQNDIQRVVYMALFVTNYIIGSEFKVSVDNSK